MRRDVSTFESRRIEAIFKEFGGTPGNSNFTFGTWYIKLTEEDALFIPAEKMRSFRVCLDHLNDQGYDRKFKGVAWLKFTVLYLKIWRNTGWNQEY